MTPRFQISHADVVRVLQRAGFSAEVIREITAQLPDPIDTDRDAEVLLRYGVTRERLMDRRGGSP